MCGLVGVLNEETFGQFEMKTTRFFKEALFADTLRGYDSTGVFLLDGLGKETKVASYKKALSAPDFLQLKVTKDLFDWQKSWEVMIGHNRAATKGGVTDETSHPFTHGNITLVHNGTITNHNSLTGGTNFKVDSEAIAYAISKDGIDKVCSQMDGAFALIFFDSDKNTLNIIRNNERPLAFGHVKDNDTTLISSEVDMMRWIASRNGMALKNVYAPKAGHLFTWDLSSGKGWAQNPTTRELKLYERKYSTQNSVFKGQSPYQGNYLKEKQELCKKLDLVIGESLIFDVEKFSSYAGGHNKGKGTLTGKPYELELANEVVKVCAYTVDEEFHKSIGKDEYVEGKISNIYKDINSGEIIIQLETATLEVVFFEDTDASVGDQEDANVIELLEHQKKELMGPKGLISTKEFDKLTKHGCIWCGANIPEEDHQEITWEDNAPLCVDCTAMNSQFNFNI